MNFIEACKAMQEGHLIRCRLWKNIDYYIYTLNGITIESSTGVEYVIKLSEVDSDSWYIYEQDHECTCEKCGKVL